ncbi:MAG: SDR family NAD(P)-dependent oxidoreductase [Acidimicrobiales bacterium]
MAIDLDFSDRVAVITGISAGGLGEGIARRFAQAGAHTALLYRSAASHAGDLATELADAGSRSVAIGADLTDEQAVEEAFSEVARELGRVDCLVNNAGVQPVTPLEQMSTEQWRSVIDTNTASTFLATRAAATRMPEGGSITHIASIEGHRMAHGHAHYCASKAAVLMHAKAAAVEYAARRVRVNSVSPGLIDRPGLSDQWPEGVNRWLDAAPAGRLGSADDVANACLFLASPLADWITGTDIVVDGGVSALPTW